MLPNDIRQRYLSFFERRGHKVIPSASVIPENDPTVLFTTAGMHPLVPYLKGERHPEGTRLTNAQKCIRTGDIDEVGDFSHLTFFEMLGNWSLGDYFKKEAIEWSFALLTDKGEGFGLDPRRLYVTVFEGDADAPPDDESIGFWKERFATVGMEAELGSRIFAYPKKKNWWGPAGLTGPCGPDTEMFWDTLDLPMVGTHKPGSAEERSGTSCHPNCDCGRFIEIWNDVFMQYDKQADGSFAPLAQKNVDTGMGFERMVMVLSGKSTVYDTELFAPIFSRLEDVSGVRYGAGGERDVALRIIADHLRAATFMIGDPRGVVPSNVDQGYVLRRLIRRAVRYGRQIGIQETYTAKIAETVIGHYGDAYPELVANKEKILAELTKEEQKFSETLERGLKEAQKVVGDTPGDTIPGDKAFYLYESFGFPKELTEEVTGKAVDATGWDVAMKAHQDLSRKGAEQKFAGGLADHSEKVVRMHTATHLLHQALRNVLGDHVEQKGSNITQERLRFDFTHGEKMTDEQKKAVEDMVNEQISKDLPVSFEMMEVDEAKAKGAIGLFDDKYAAMGNKIKVYGVGSDEKGYFSREICGGPHVEHTALVGPFKIKKEEASSAGIRRIKAVVEDRP